MREIKFKGKRLEDDKLVYGFLLNNETIGTVGAKLKHYRYSTVKPETIRQFIGIQDLNGQDIYEGDKIESGIFGKGIIKYDDYKCGFIVDWENGNEAIISHANKAKVVNS